MRCKVPGGLRVVVLAIAATMAAVTPPVTPAVARAQEEPAADEPPFLEGQDRLDVATPAMRLERPSDSWQFLNLEVLERRAREAHQDVRGYEALKARLWHGTTRSNIFVKAFPDTVHRAEPPAAADLAGPMAENLVAALVEGQLKQQGAVRVGPRAGWIFEVHGRPRGARPDAPPVAIVSAVVYRPEDHHIFTFTLEGPAEKITPLKRDLLKLLRKARL